MKFNPKVTGGLAWAGLIVVLAVPSADMLTKSQGQAASTVTSRVDAIRTASTTAKPAAAAKPASDDPVDTYLSSGKKLPSYISDAPTAVASQKPVTTPRLVVPTTPARQAPASSVEVASLDAAAPAVAPVPYPASMRPKAPVAPAASAVADDEAPLILDEDLVKRRETAVAEVLSDDPDVAGPAGIVRGDQLEEWDSGSLAQYLERRGLLSEDEQQASTSPDYDPDGFFLDEGPNGDRRLIRRAQPRDFLFF